MKKQVKYSSNGKTTVLDIKFKDGRLSITGCCFTGTRLFANERNLISAGQCVDEAFDCGAPFPLIDIWHRWHLNDLRAGTPKQEEAIREWTAQGNRYDYKAACEYLKELGIYDDNGTKYGHQWLTEEVPADVIAYLETL